MLKFEVTITDDDLEQCYGTSDFLYIIKEAAIKKAVDNMCDSKVNVIVNEEIKEVVKEHKEEIIHEIIEKVTNGVAEKIEKKKEVLAITPKISELNKINKDNEKYFMELIDKAIGKKFR